MNWKKYSVLSFAALNACDDVNGNDQLQVALDQNISEIQAHQAEVKSKLEQNKEFTENQRIQQPCKKYFELCQERARESSRIILSCNDPGAVENCQSSLEISGKIEEINFKFLLIKCLNNELDCLEQNYSGDST
jgi:hypothetical protein